MTSDWQFTELASQTKGTERGSRIACCALVMLAGVLTLLALDARAQEAARPAPAAQVQVEAIVEEKPLPARTNMRGHVAYENTGRPVRRARVLLLNKNGRGGEKAGITDARGNFQIKGVQEGMYYIMVDAAGIVTPISMVEFDRLKDGDVQKLEIEKQFEAVSVDGINDKDVEVRVRRGGSISGRVTYEDGDPVVSARINIMRLKNGRPTRFITNISPSAFVGYQTDDRGMYRFSGLPPGEYIVSASENIDHGDSRRGMDDEFMASIFFGNALVVTYYRNGTSFRTATPVKIEGSEEENNIDITLLERPLHVISGTAVSKQGRRPLASARVSLSRKDSGPATIIEMGVAEFLPKSETDELGQWSFKDVPDGDYTITVQPPYPTETTTEEEVQSAPDRTTTIARSGKRLSSTQRDVKMNGEDVSDIVLELSEGARIKGTVTVERGKPLPGGAAVLAQAAGSEGSISTRGYIETSGQFVMDGVPAGRVYLDVSTPEAKYYVKSIVAGGVDLSHEPLLVQEGAEITGVRVVLSAELAMLAGRVLNSSNEPLASAYVYLYPVDQSQWNRLEHVQSTMADAKGLFSVSAAPGEYYVIVLRPDEDSTPRGGEYIKSRIQTAPRVRLQANEQKSLDLTAPDPK